MKTPTDSPMTLGQLVEVTGLGRDLLRSEIDAGNLAALKIRGRRLVYGKDVAAWLARHRTGPASIADGTHVAIPAGFVLDTGTAPNPAAGTPEVVVNVVAKDHFGTPHGVWLGVAQVTEAEA